MSTNDQIILDQILEEQRSAQISGASKSEFFEIYSAEQVLKDYDLSMDEIEYGLVGGTQDGGLDAIYTLVNGELVQEDFDYTYLKKNLIIDVVVIQSKTSNGFDEETINKLIAVTTHLFSLTNPLDSFRNRYNDGVRSGVGIFRELFTATASRFPDIRFHYIYATRGDSEKVHPNVKSKAEDLKNVVLGLFSKSSFRFSFFGAADLLALARKQPVTAFNIQFTESLTGDSGYIALVKLKDFIGFIRADSGQLRKNLFEANVRDYQGTTQVNEDMQSTLSDRGSEDFWWLNNGITVVASKAGQAGKILTLEDPQIVNGQQTSTEIYNYFHTRNTINDERSVMVRVVVTNDPVSRDRIIKATNSQTAIPLASLRATEKIHRDIEDFLSPYGIYYDRRKNSQKQQGRPADSIISISLLAQAVMSTLLQRSDDARARPSSLIKKDDEYSRIFIPSLPINIYLVAAVTIKKSHSFLRTKTDLAPKDRNNMLFYIAMCVVSTLSDKAAPNEMDMAGINCDGITENILEKCFRVVETFYISLGANDQVAKGPQLTRLLKEHLAGNI